MAAPGRQERVRKMIATRDFIGAKEVIEVRPRFDRRGRTHYVVRCICGELSKPGRRDQFINQVGCMACNRAGPPQKNVIVDGQITCMVCNETKSVNKFFKDKTYKCGYSRKCIVCTYEYKQQYRNDNPLANRAWCHNR